MVFKFSPIIGKKLGKRVSKATFLLVTLSLLTTACSTTRTATQKSPSTAQVPEAEPKSIKKDRRSVKTKTVHPLKPTNPNAFGYRLSAAAKARTKHNVVYDGRYIKIGYPWGDVPQNIGVCTDVVIRSYRKLGIDLQQQVHQDMKNGFNAYPNLSKWQLKGPDANIDHRRVYNLQAFLTRHGTRLPVTNNPYHYKPGDLVTWQLGPGQGHIGIVVNERSKQDPKRHLIVHNIAEGPKMEDVLFRFPVTGHYRYSGKMRHYRPTYVAKNSSQQVVIPGVGTIPPELLR